MTRRLAVVSLALGVAACGGDEPSADPPDPGFDERPEVSVPALLDEAGAALDRGTPPDLREAARAYRAVLKQDPRAEEARYGIALAEQRSGRAWAAMWQMDRLLLDFPHHAGALRYLGLAAFQQGRTEAAAEYLTALSTVRKLDDEEMLALADAGNRLNAFVRAESLFTEMIGRIPGGGPERPDDARAAAAYREARGYARWKQGRLGDAEADYAAALAADPGAHRAAVYRAIVLLDLNRTEEAREQIEAVAPADAEAAGLGAEYVTVGARIALRGGAEADIARARIALEDLAERRPDNIDVWHLLARVRRQRGDLDGARAAALRHREALAAQSGTAQALAQKEFVQGAIAEEAGDLEAALEAYERGLGRDPSSITLLCASGGVLAALERKEEARLRFGALRDLVGGPPAAAFMNTGRDLLRRGLPAAAARQFELAQTRLPGREDPLYYRAHALLAAGDRAAALEVAAPLEAEPVPARP